jgi:hypothetical protein
VQAGFMSAAPWLVEVIFTVPGIRQSHGAGAAQPGPAAHPGHRPRLFVIVLMLNPIVEEACLGLNPKLART